MVRILMICVVTMIAAFFSFNIQELFPNKDFKHATLAQFADFYSGLLGTIITFVGLYYIYQSFQQQREQLDIAKKDSDFTILNTLYNDLLQEINSIQYRKSKNEKGETLIRDELYQGIDAIYNFDISHWRNPNSVINHLNSIVLSFEQLLIMTNKIRYKYQDMKDIMLTKIFFLFYSKILWPGEDLYAKREIYGLTRYSSDSILFFNAYEKLTRQSIEYLVEKERIAYVSVPKTRTV